MSAYLYQIILMGGKDARLAALKTAVAARATDLGIDPNEIVYLGSGPIDFRLRA